MTSRIYEFPDINTKLEGTVAILNSEERIYFSPSYMEDYDGGELDDQEAMNIDDGRIKDEDSEVIKEWLDKNNEG